MNVVKRWAICTADKATRLAHMSTSNILSDNPA